MPKVWKPLEKSVRRSALPLVDRQNESVSGVGPVDQQSVKHAESAGRSRLTPVQRARHDVSATSGIVDVIPTSLDEVDLAARRPGAVCLIDRQHPWLAMSVTSKTVVAGQLAGIGGGRRTDGWPQPFSARHLRYNLHSPVADTLLSPGVKTR